MSTATGGGSGALALEPVRDIASVRADWTRLADQSENVFSTWEWADAWLRYLGAGTKPAVAVAKDVTGRTTAILPLCVVRERPVRVVRLLGAGPSDELGPISAQSEREAATVALTQHAVQTLGASGIFLGERLRGRDPSPPHLSALVIRRSASPVLPLAGGSFEAFLASQSRNFRQQVRRLERGVARAGRLVYRLTENTERLESDLRTLMALHGARWGDERSGAFANGRASFHLQFARRALENGWLRLWILELDDRPVAAWYGLRYAGIESFYQSGRDPALDRLNVGFVLLCHTIRCAFEDGMREYRFGLGGEPYKSRFTELDPGLHTVAITTGAGGRLALAGLQAAFRSPPAMRRLAWRVTGGRGR